DAIGHRRIAERELQRERCEFTGRKAHQLRRVAGRLRDIDGPFLAQQFDAQRLRPFTRPQLTVRGQWLPAVEAETREAESVRIDQDADLAAGQLRSIARITDQRLYAFRLARE